MRKGGGFGLVILVVVLAVVLLLVARAWKAMAPTAVQLSGGEAPFQIDTRGEEEAGAALHSGKLPDLNDMRQQTGSHVDRLNEALAEIE